jgi:hypothetical protein
MAKEGIGTLQMTLGETNYTYVSITPGNTDKVRLIYTPDPTKDYSVAWDTYFMKISGMTRTAGTPGSGSPITYTLPIVSTLVIKKYEVKIKNI